MLTIAGSDPSGGAGVQADIKTATALGVYAMSVITALTAQNTLGVRSFIPVDPGMLEAQLEAVLDDITPDAVKIGMLPDAGAVSTVARVIRARSLKNVVLDPVLVATSGDALSSGDTRGALLRELAPLCAVITPNLPETSALLDGRAVASLPDMTKAGCDLRALTGAGAVLVKGGHGHGASLVDLLVADGHIDEHFHRRVETVNTHGTGCTLSSAIACFLAAGMEVDRAVSRAINWLQGAIEAAAGIKMGHGHGPVNHMYQLKKAYEYQD